jgi:hypothetical protein
MSELPEPYLKFGLLCEHVLQEKDGVLSFIRIVDRFTVSAKGTKVPAEMPPGEINLTAVMGWWGGLGKHIAKIKVIMPGGEWESPPFTVFLDSLERGQNIIANFTLAVKQEGLYWVEFLLNSKVKSRMPFRIIYEPISMPSAPSGEEA